jgi:high-affinity iron transporter
MIAATIIVLREVLEICLVIGVVSAALKELPNRLRLIFMGVSVGLFISAILALSLNKISDFFDGNGQEILNIVILSVAILCVAWTLFWVNNQGKVLYAKVSSVSQNLKVWPIISIISLSVAREGAELILFLHGVAAGGTKAADLTYGIIAGMLIGVSLGVSLYNGLLKLSVKYFFKIINILLVLLAAGMASHLANYLHSSDIITSFSSTMWNSSWLIGDDSLIAKLLHGLIGYSSHPTILQVIFYCLTILFLIIPLNIKFKK